MFSTHKNIHQYHGIIHVWKPTNHMDILTLNIKNNIKLQNIELDYIYPKQIFLTTNFLCPRKTFPGIPGHYKLWYNYVVTETDVVQVFTGIHWFKPGSWSWIRLFRSDPNPGFEMRSDQEPVFKKRSDSDLGQIGIRIQSKHRGLNQSKIGLFLRYLLTKVTSIEY